MAPPKPNGFSVFMFEYIAQEKKKGNNMSPAQGQSVCGPLWQVSAPFRGYMFFDCFF